MGIVRSRGDRRRLCHPYFDAAPRIVETRSARGLSTANRGAGARGRRQNGSTLFRGHLDVTLGIRHLNLPWNVRPFSVRSVRRPSIVGSAGCGAPTGDPRVRFPLPSLPTTPGT